VLLLEVVIGKLCCCSDAGPAAETRKHRSGVLDDEKTSH